MTVNAAAQTFDPSIPRNQGSPWLLKLFYSAAAVFVIAVLAFNIFKPIKVLPRVRLAPGFAFTNQDGIRKTSEDFRGKLTIYNFTYIGCGTDCVQTTLDMQSLRDALARSASGDVKFALVTISIDPEHDTPATLKTYVTPLLTKQSNTISWDFLTGDALITKYVVGGGFNVFYQNMKNQPGQSMVQFEPRYVLVDGWGIIRAEYRDPVLDVPLVMRDIGYLEAEIRSSQGPARYAYEAAHLFRCYP